MRTRISAGLMALAFGALFCCAPASAQVPLNHAPGATTPDGIDQELEKVAADMRARYNANAARYVYYDIAWPRDPEEYEALGKYAVLLIVAVSHDETELPLRRVFLDGRGSVQARSVATRQRPTKPGSAANRVLGSHRHETLYLVPVEALLQERALVADFAVNRTDFRIAQAPFGAPDFAKNDPKPKAGKVTPAALDKLVSREFPGFAIRR